MTLRNLRIFLAVADCGSMSEAAKKMHIAQPSVSGTISEIEEQYQVRLFERLGRRLYITPTGEQLCEYARHILSAFDSMEQRLRNADDTDMLRIGATVTVGTCILGDVLKRYIAETGHPAPRVLVDNTQVIEQQLLKSELDAAIVEGSISSPDLVTQCMMNDPLALWCAQRITIRLESAGASAWRNCSAFRLFCARRAAAHERCLSARCRTSTPSGCATTARQFCTASSRASA